MPLGKRTDYGDARYAGVEVKFTSDIDPVVQDSLLCGFDFIVAPLVRPDYRPPPPGSAGKGQLVAPFKRQDVLYLPSQQRTSQVVGQVSAWIDPDSDDAGLASQSVVCLKQELAWAAHLGLQAVVLPPVPQPLRSANYSQAVQQSLSGLSHMALWLTVPLTVPATSASGTAEGTGSTSAAAARQADSWEWWNQFRSLTDFHNLLGVVLELGPELPPPDLLDRWLGEPLKAVLLPTSSFSTNKRGYPLLPRPHQELLAKLMRYQVQVVLTGDRVHDIPPEPSPPAGPGAAPGVVVDAVTGIAISNPGEQHPLRPYWEYLCYLFRKLDVLPDQERLESDYRDYLQAPLQPLQDNLESQTYETFEKDVTKYSQYEEAVYRALLDRVPPESAGSTVTTLMVVGAGRGPLVRSSMRASERAGRRLRVFAVEKNPNAIVHIQEMLRKEGWEEQVSIVSADMRHWQAPEQADILVSELLGSFGDNELSPECLDGAQRFLKADGVSIPQSYTSFMAPVTSHKLYNDVKAYKDVDHFETPYVVKFHKHYLLGPPQPIFTFNHPNWADHIDNSRYGRFKFERDASLGGAVMHGFAGYFECALYKDVTLNTHPPTHTPNMFSWFPIFFPLREPVYVPRGEAVEAHMWRCCAAHKVWYEWSVTAPVPVPVHNIGGRSYYVGL